MNTPKVGRAKQARLAKLTPAERFFYEHAGYSYDPKIETAEQGRVRCARSLAKAEQLAERLGWYTDWEYDTDADDSWMTDEEREQPHECYCARLWDSERQERVIAALGGIFDPTQEYQRVIEAELALEAESELDREIETLDAH